LVGGIGVWPVPFLSTGKMPVPPGRQFRFDAPLPFILSSHAIKSTTGSRSLTATLPISKIGEVGGIAMDRRPVSRRHLLLLIAGVLLLPMVAWAIVAVAAILGAMGDSAGAATLNRVAWGCGALWAVDLVCLVIAEGLNSLADKDQHQ
jgi:hypothetical protein